MGDGGMLIFIVQAQDEFDSRFLESPPLDHLPSQAIQRRSLSEFLRTILFLFHLLLPMT